MTKKAFQALVAGKSPKGDVLETAKVAGIMAAKSTHSIIPMCHPLEINKVSVAFKLNKKRYTATIIAEVLYVGRTGVEMEALTAVTVAALTIYDMMKGIDRNIVISDIALLSKMGGKSGTYIRKT